MSTWVNNYLQVLGDWFIVIFSTMVAVGVIVIPLTIMAIDWRKSRINSKIVEKFLED